MESGKARKRMSESCALKAWSFLLLAEGNPLRGDALGRRVCEAVTRVIGPQ